MRTYWLKDPSVEAELFDGSEEMAKKYKVHDLRKAHEELKSGVDINGFWIPWDQKYWIIEYPTGETDVMDDDKFQQLYAKDSFLEGLGTDAHQASDELEHIKSDYWKKIAENDQLRSENTKLKKDDFTDKLLSESFSERCASVALLLMFAAGAVVAVLAAWKCVFN